MAIRGAGTRCVEKVAGTVMCGMPGRPRFAIWNDRDRVTRRSRTTGPLGESNFRSTWAIRVAFGCGRQDWRGDDRVLRLLHCLLLAAFLAGGYLVARDLLGYPIHARIVSTIFLVTVAATVVQLLAWRWLIRSERFRSSRSAAFWLSAGGTHGIALFALLAELWQRDHPFHLGTFEYLLIYLLLAAWLVTRRNVYIFWLIALSGLYAYIWTGFYLFGFVPDMNVVGNVADLTDFVSPVTRFTMIAWLLISLLALVITLVVFGRWLTRRRPRLAWGGGALLAGWLGFFGAGDLYMPLGNLMSRLGLVNHAQQQATIATIGLLPTWLLENLQQRGRLLALQGRDAGAGATSRMTELNELVRGIEAENLPNIHLVLLESWIDIHAFAAPYLRSVPTPPGFVDLAKHLTDSVTPVFGGGTANAEFEALCGVPALRKVGAIEFNALRGGLAPCLPNLLAGLGYRTVMTSAFDDAYFNSRRAYTSIGFDEQYYACSYCEEYGVRKTGEDAVAIFDGDLFTANLRFLGIGARRASDPLFNYLVTGYGHYPFARDREARPDVWQHPELEDDLVRAVNIGYYRELAVAELIGHLRSADPDSILVLFGDHLPMVDLGGEIYRRYGYRGDGDVMRVPVLFVVRGRTYRFAPIHHYDIPYILVGLLRGDLECGSTYACDYHPGQPSEEDYYRIIRAALAE